MRKSKSPLSARTMFLCIVSLFILSATTNAQLRQRHITGVNISPEITNYLEHLPSGYNLPANASKKYPMIIYWKGLFDYSVSDVCIKGIPQKIESYVFPEVVTYNGTQYSFIVITPMYVSGGTSAADVEATINYMVNRYRIDRNRIYMTGISKGASLCYEYVNASSVYAKKIAAIAPLAPCLPLNWNGANNVVNTQMHLWGLHNPLDLVCNVINTTSSVNAVTSINPNPVLARYTLTPTNWSPDSHDIFWIPYEPSYTTPESDNKNMYDWFIQYSQNVVLPVSLKDFTARLNQGKVKLEWITSAENNSGTFTVERAGRDMKFTTLTTLDASGYSSAEHKYEAFDNSPQNGMNFYRLAQTDRDGKTQYFEVRRVLNGKQVTSVVVAPNPVRNNITVFVNVEKAQKLTLSLIDAHGRTIRSVERQYREGLQEIFINAEDLAPGNYLLKVKGASINTVEKLLKL
ncbi:MAG TPA: T9SS type A sorting domain-containing protein [Chitinophagaceae bacterium]